MEKTADFEIRNTYKTDSVQEFSVDYDGYNYLVIYGHHINGWFIAVPNWKVCVETTIPQDIFYNAEKLSGVFERPNVPHAIAMAVKEHWENHRKVNR